MIRIFVTGGTFDKTYDEIRGGLAFADTHLPEMLRLGRSRVDVSVRTLMMIDSLEMTEADRELIVRNCQQCDEDRIVITHGTDTMVETAAALAAGVYGKTVVLTGAMIPYAFGSSDGLFNLGSALSFAQVLPAGVYVAMNGQHFAWDAVRKNYGRGEVAPPQLEPAPAVQPKQCGPTTMRRLASEAAVASKIVCGASAAVPRSIIWLKSQS